MKVADFVVDYLGRYGIKEIFVVSGAANAFLIDAFVRTDATKYVAVMHEQAGGFAAEGYAKISGKPGATIVTSGPGGMNLVTPIGNFYYDSIPGIFITGQINSDFLRSDPAIRQVGFQETDIVSIVKPITKYAVLITDPKSVRYEIEKAIFIATEGRPGPVLIDIPVNIQKMEINPEELIGFDSEGERKPYNLELIDQKIDQFLSDFSKSKRPGLIIGGGVRLSGAVDALLELGRKMKIPMYPTWNALDIVTSDYEYYGGRIGTYGGRGRNFGLQNSDLVLAIGSRISGRITGGNLSSFLREAKKYVVDVDDSLLQKKLQQVPFDVSIHSDAKLFIERLTKKIGNLSALDFSDWNKKVFAWKDKYDPVLPEYFKEKKFVHPYVFFRTLSESMQAKDILVGDCGGNIVASNHSFETKYGQRNITNNGNSPMGFSFAGAMGAWFASDKKQNVVCTIGDGGFNMNPQELQTFVTYGVKVKTFIINNHVYGIIRAYQSTNIGGRYEASGPKGYVPPDFIKIAEAYSVKTFTIKNHSELKEKIKAVLDYDGAVICDVDCGLSDAYDPRIFGWKTPIEDMYPYLPREEFRSNMIIDPLPGWETPEMPNNITSKANTIE